MPPVPRTLLHTIPPTSHAPESNHTFTSEQVDWGFSQMLPLQDVSPSSGYVRDDGTLIVRVEITIQRDERFTYDSRAETGFVGLKNQGATCYMNSLLQYMFNVPYFRKVGGSGPCLGSRGLGASGAGRR